MVPLCVPMTIPARMGWLLRLLNSLPRVRRALFLSNRGTRISPGQVANRVKYWLLKAGIRKNVGPHGLRHTFATHLYAVTSDLLVVKRALGHRDITTTEIYIHLVDGALEEAIERL